MRSGDPPQTVAGSCHLLVRPPRIRSIRKRAGTCASRSDHERRMHTKELYDLVWSQPMKPVAASVGISDLALAKQCKKANIPVPNRGYWARKQAGKPTIQIALPPRFPGASERVGGPSRQHYYYGSEWAEEFRKVTVPPAPTFDEEMSSVEERARILVGRVRCQHKFEPSHPLVAKLPLMTRSVNRNFPHGVPAIPLRNTTLASSGGGY